MREENPVLDEYKKAAIGTTSNAFGKKDAVKDRNRGGGLRNLDQTTTETV